LLIAAILTICVWARSVALHHWHLLSFAGLLIEFLDFENLTGSSLNVVNILFQLSRLGLLLRRRLAFLAASFRARIGIFSRHVLSPPLTDQI
jgi:hypothetical protein